MRLYAGLALVLTVLALGLVSLVYTPFTATKLSAQDRLAPPSATHLFGADQLGRDQLTRIMVGARTVLAVAVGAVGAGAAAGTALGLASGLVGGWADELFMRAMDGLFAFPALLLALVIVAALGPGAFNTALAIGISALPVFARLARAEALKLRHLEFVEAARAAGARDERLLWRHILPNAAGPLIIQFSASLAAAVVAEAGLSYLGLGIQPPEPSWGRMLNEAQTFMGRAPHLALFPGLAIAWTVLGLNLLGDGLRDRLDPRLRR